MGGNQIFTEIITIFQHLLSQCVFSGWYIFCLITSSQFTLHIFEAL